MSAETVLRESCRYVVWTEGHQDFAGKEGEISNRPVICTWSLRWFRRSAHGNGGRVKGRKKVEVRQGAAQKGGRRGEEQWQNVEMALGRSMRLDLIKGERRGRRREDFKEVRRRMHWLKEPYQPFILCQKGGNSEADCGGESDEKGGGPTHPSGGRGVTSMQVFSVGHQGWLKRLVKRKAHLALSRLGLVRRHDLTGRGADAPKTE